jgi:linoleoyl-CoA desaturase
VTGFVISVVFQLAHVVEAADFPEAIVAPDRMNWHWANHQVMTTVDFAPRSKVVSWIVGGLNYQVEHHLFPRLCHMHYPKIAPIVARVCHRHGLPYKVNQTFSGALASHYRLLRDLGRGLTPA